MSWYRRCGPCRVLRHTQHRAEIHQIGQNVPLAGQKKTTHIRAIRWRPQCANRFFFYCFSICFFSFSIIDKQFWMCVHRTVVRHTLYSLSLSQIHARKKINRKLYVRTYERTWAKKSYDHVGRDHTLYRPPLSHTHTSTQTAHRHSHEQWVEKKTKSTDEWICSLLSVTFCRLHACQTTACSVDFFSTLFMILSHKRRTTIRHSVQSHTLRAMLYEY